MKIIIEVTAMEALELAAMAMAACVTFPKGKRKPPLIKVLGKIGKKCMDTLTDEQREFVNKMLEATRLAYEKPSIERGYLIGGFQAMEERIASIASKI